MRDHLTPWRSATTLADLGELTALWLEGKIDSQPGYATGCGPDEETLPLVDVLAATNRAGYVTISSQPGADCVGFDGAHWRQRAGVQGFAGGALCEQLVVAATECGLTVIVQRARRWGTTHDHAVTVTERAGRPVTGFGACLSRWHIRNDWVGYGACPRAAQDALNDAWQIALIDPDWGRNDRLWPLLREVASR